MIPDAGRVAVSAPGGGLVNQTAGVEQTDDSDIVAAEDMIVSRVFPRWPGYRAW
jgi:hypothetical protein